MRDKPILTNNEDTQLCHLSKVVFECAIGSVLPLVPDCGEKIPSTTAALTSVMYQPVLIPGHQMATICHVPLTSYPDV